MFKELSQFTPLIQLITGVNFAFILGNFIDKVIQVLRPERIIEDERETIKESSKKPSLFRAFRIPVIANIIIDIESLKALEHINDPSKNRVDDLIKKYESLKDKRSNRRKNLIKRIESNKEKHNNNGSFKPLFLICSLYCIISLIVSCLGGNEYVDFAKKCNLDITFLEISFNILSFLILTFCIGLLIVSLIKGVQNLAKHFIISIILFTIILILSFITGRHIEDYQSNWFTNICNNYVFWNVAFWISVFLPFFALLSCCIYIFYLRIEGKIELHWYNLLDRIQLHKLRKEKKKIDDAFKIFITS